MRSGLRPPPDVAKAPPFTATLCVNSYMKKFLNIESFSEIERDVYLKDTWCEVCKTADLGISKAQLYIENERKFVEGSCLSCGTTCVSEIMEKRID